MNDQPSVIVDASWQERWAGAGLVLTLDGASTARAYAYHAPDSVSAELHGIRLALGWLGEIKRGPGMVYCDCEGAVTRRRELGMYDHGVAWLRQGDRDTRYLRAHQAGALAREMAKRLQTATIGPLPVPLAMTPTNPAAAVAARPAVTLAALSRPAPPRFPVTVVLDGVPDMHAYARILTQIPGDALPVLFGQFLSGNQAMFGTKLTEDEGRRLADIFDQLGVAASLYIRPFEETR